MVSVGMGVFDNCTKALNQLNLTAVDPGLDGQTLENRWRDGMCSRVMGQYGFGDYPNRHAGCGVY